MKILFVATVVKGHIMAFHLPYLKMCQDLGWETAVAAKNDYTNPEECNIPYCDTYYNIPFDRSPFSESNLKAYRQLRDIIRNGGFRIVHCHTPVGGALARFAGRKARNEFGLKMIYTAHGFHFYAGAPLLYWLTYYPVERFLARFTDVLITINKEDHARARKFRSEKARFVPGVGIDTGRFSKRDPKLAPRLRESLGIPQDALVLLSVGELSKRKNHQVVIRALAKIVRQDVYYVICGDGALMEKHKELAQSLGLANRVILTGYRNDVADLYQTADLFVFPSLHEGLPVAIMEAMASGLAVVCSKIRGNEDLVVEDRGGLYALESDANEYARKIEILISNRELAKRMGEWNLERIVEFDLAKIKHVMQGIYFDCAE